MQLREDAINPPEWCTQDSKFRWQWSQGLGGLRCSRSQADWGGSPDRPLFEQKCPADCGRLVLRSISHTFRLELHHKRKRGVANREPRSRRCHSGVVDIRLDLRRRGLPFLVLSLYIWSVERNAPEMAMFKDEPRDYDFDPVGPQQLEVIKVRCRYRGTLNGVQEKNCTACGATL